MPSSPSSAPPVSASAISAPQTYRAGSLVYDVRGLRRVFSWLLAAEVVFVLIDVIEPKLLPVLLKFHGANDKEIAIIVGSFNAALQLLIMPPLGYYSDRLRTRWGRRIPLLFWATPFATLFLAITPFAPEIADWLGQSPTWSSWLGAIPVAPTIVVFAVLVILYRAVQTVTNVTFFGLLRDVVPDTHMGRFLALFRIFGAAGTFIVTYWLLAHAETHSKPIFIGVALLNLVGFTALCYFVREGTYPPVEKEDASAHGKSRPARFFGAVRTFVSESYRHPIYLWVYLIRICCYGVLLGLSGFSIFFPQYELGMSLAQVGAMTSWPLLVWLVIAYPIGRLIDARGAIFVLNVSLAVIAVGYALSFFLVIGPISFFVSSMVTGVAFWVVMLAQLKLTQEVFHPQRYSQLAGANTVVQSLLIAILISPLAGWFLDELKGWHHTLAVPGVGDVELGPYRFVNLMMALLYGLGWYGVMKVRRHWLARGGPHHYVAPL